MQSSLLGGFVVKPPLIANIDWLFWHWYSLKICCCINMNCHKAPRSVSLHQPGLDGKQWNKLRKLCVLTTQSVCYPGLQIAFKSAGYVKIKYFSWVFNRASWFVPVNLGTCLKNPMQLLNRNWWGEKGESQSKPWGWQPYHCPEASSGVSGLFFLQSSQAECPEKAMKEDKHQPWLSPFNRRFNWYRSEVNLQYLFRLTACHKWLRGFTTTIVQLLKEKEYLQLCCWSEVSKSIQSWIHSVTTPHPTGF